MWTLCLQENYQQILPCWWSWFPPSTCSWYCTLKGRSKMTFIKEKWIYLEENNKKGKKNSLDSLMITYWPNSSFSYHLFLKWSCFCSWLQEEVMIMSLTLTFWQAIIYSLLSKSSLSLKKKKKVKRTCLFSVHCLIICYHLLMLSSKKQTFHYCKWPNIL